MIISTFSTIVRALRPHQVEFETWSSALDLPGIESTEPGEDRVRFSITSAESEHCTVAKPVFRPRLPASRLRGRP